MKKLTEKVLYSGRWISLKKLYMRGKNGQDFEWEYIQRRNNSSGIIIIAQLLPSRRIVLIKQFRPPINNYIIGFPAGIAESNDIAGEALRELIEETGLSGKITSISPPLKSHPALMNDQAYIVNVEIDENLPANHDPIQDLEVSEEIEVIYVPVDSINDFLNTQMEKGYEVGIGPWYTFCVQIK